MNKTRNKIIRGITQVEGGYVNDSSDSGGKTKFGITETVARHEGYEGEIAMLPLEFAMGIYKHKYWDKLHLDYIASFSVTLAEELMDTAVNQGVSAASTYLQKSLNLLNDGGILHKDLTVDGHIGNKSLGSLERYIRYRSGNGLDVLRKMVNCMQGAFYIELATRREKDERFIYGWFLNRIS